MSWNLDFTGTTTQEVENQNGNIPDGFHRVKLESTRENTQTGDQEFEFTISHGPFAGRKLRTVKLNNPSLATGNAETVMKKARAWAVRMGVVGADANGKQVSPQWSLAIGKELVVELESQEYTKDDGSKGMTQRPKFAGIFPLEHTDIPNHARAVLGLPPIAGNEGVTRAGAGGGKSSGGKGNAAPAPTAAENQAAADKAANLMFG